MYFIQFSNILKVVFATFIFGFIYNLMFVFLRTEFWLMSLAYHRSLQLKEIYTQKLLLFCDQCSSVTEEVSPLNLSLIIYGAKGVLLY